MSDPSHISARTRHAAGAARACLPFCGKVSCCLDRGMFPASGETHERRPFNICFGSLRSPNGVPRGLIWPAHSPRFLDALPTAFSWVHHNLVHHHRLAHALEQDRGKRKERKERERSSRGRKNCISGQDLGTGTVANETDEDQDRSSVSPFSVRTGCRTADGEDHPLAKDQVQPCLLTS